MPDNQGPDNRGLLYLSIKKRLLFFVLMLCYRFHFQRFCAILLSNFSSLKWSSEVTLLGLNALRIFTREHEGSSNLLSPFGLTPLIHLAGLDKDYQAVQDFFKSDDVCDDIIGGVCVCVCVFMYIWNLHIEVTSDCPNVKCLDSISDWSQGWLD